MSKINGAQMSSGDTAETPKIAREYTRPEKWLLPIALVLGILFDRLIINGLAEWYPHIYKLTSAFWLCYLVLYYVFNRAKLLRNRLTWIIGAFTALLCVWSFFFSHPEYSELTMVVIPCVLMAHAQIAAQDIGMKQVCRIVAAWFSGFFIRPFSAMRHFFGAATSCVGGGKKSLAKNLTVAALISIALLAVIIPLLMRADMVFSYFVSRAFVNISSPGKIIGHGIVILAASILFYSHLWNARYKGPIVSQELDDGVFSKLKLERLVTYIVISAVLLVYLLFCTVQIKYVFARADLPAALTYSEYAQEAVYVREGFAQMVAVCVVNLLLFGFFIHSSKREWGISALLVLLLAVTAVILVSSAVRLGLYTEAYGMTWLRLLSFWFMVFVAIAIIVCAVRLFVPKLPAVSICALILLIWYTALGYASPGRLIREYNTRDGYEFTEYTDMENQIR